MAMKKKRRGFNINIRSFTGTDGATYIVFMSLKGSYHTFRECEAKQAAVDCGAKRLNSQGKERNTRTMWRELWRKQDQSVR